MLPDANCLALFTERGGESYSYLGNGIHIFRKLNFDLAMNLCSGGVEEGDRWHWEPPRISRQTFLVN